MIPVLDHSSALFRTVGVKKIPKTLPNFYPFARRHLLNSSEVEEAKERIKEWKASPEAREEEGAVCPIAEVAPTAHRHLSRAHAF